MVDRLEKLKKTAEKHMKDQIKIINMLASLSMNEVVEFNKWYKNHQYYKEVPEIVQSLSQMNMEKESK